MNIKKHSGCSERHFLLASDRLSVASVATRISTVADGVLLLPALGARISLAHAPALVIPLTRLKRIAVRLLRLLSWMGSRSRLPKRGRSGFDVHKRIRGRNRHILVDSRYSACQPSQSCQHVRSARSCPFARRSSPIFPTINTVIADAGHQSRKLTRLIKAEATSFASSNAVSGVRGCGLTWIVERTFAWIGRYRR